MSLGTPQFLIFFTVISIVYYLLPHKLRSGWLLLGNLAFYAFGAPGYLPLLLVTILGSYFAALGIERRDGRARKLLTALSVVLLVAVLCLFKYAARPLGSLLAGFPLFGSLLASSSSGYFSLIMPLGISFYTFSVLGYLLDVSNGKVKAEHNFIVYALFVSFFPTLLSGPINRAGELLPQLHEEHSWNYRQTVEGLQRFLLGAFKKVVLADGLSLIVNGVWSNLSDYYGLTLVLVVFLYTIQLYCDFAGYSDMAVGAARILGFSVRENFSAPYLACSLTDFWARWHLSLTSWFRDYVYIPLGGNRKGYFRKLINILIIFLLSGLWHGNTISFLIWGLLHGVVRCLEDLVYPKRTNHNPLLLIPIRWLATQGFVSIAWIFFRAPSLAAAGQFLSQIATPVSFSTVVQQLLYLLTVDIANSGTYYLLLLGGLAVGSVVLVLSDILLYRNLSRNIPHAHNTLGLVKRPALRMVLYWSLGILTMLFYFISFTKLNGGVSFIYAGF